MTVSLLQPKTYMFPAFPEFIPLTLELKEAYNKTVETFPPYSDISFATLQIWWNLSEKLSISLLNQNVVIRYDLAFDKANSGLCLIGESELEASIMIIFDYLRQNKEEVKLVHVPEFVIERLQDRGRFTVEEEPDYSEYILDSAALVRLEGHDYKRLRNQVKRFTREVENKHIDIRELDLSLEHVQEQLFESILAWEDKDAPNNDPSHTEHQALRKTLAHSRTLGIKNLALYVDNKLHGVLIYHRPLSKDYFVIHHLKVSYAIPYISDYMHHEIAKRATDSDVSKLNIEMDLGVENLRTHKLKLNPVGYLKKYTVTPA